MSIAAFFFGAVTAEAAATAALLNALSTHNIYIYINVCNYLVTLLIIVPSTDFSLNKGVHSMTTITQPIDNKKNQKSYR